MANLVQRYWTSDGGGITRKDRQGCEYFAYIPDKLVGRGFSLDGASAHSESRAAHLAGESRTVVRRS